MDAHASGSTASTSSSTGSAVPLDQSALDSSSDEDMMGDQEEIGLHYDIEWEFAMDAGPQTGSQTPESSGPEAR